MRHNAVIIGRKTWDTMDQLTSKPFPNALNIVLSRDNLPDVINIDNTIVCESLDSVVRRLQQEPNLDQVFTILKLQNTYYRQLYLKQLLCSCVQHKCTLSRWSLKFLLIFQTINYSSILRNSLVGVTTSPATLTCCCQV